MTGPCVVNLRLMAICLCAWLPLLFSGCGAARPLNLPGSETAQIIKNYQSLFIPANRPHWTGSGVEIEMDDIVVIIAYGQATTSTRKQSSTNAPPERKLFARVGEGEPFRMQTLPLATDVEEAGELRFAVSDWRSMSRFNPNWYRDNTGGYTLHIFVVPRHRWGNFEVLLAEIVAANPDESEAAQQIRALLGPPADKVANMDYGQLMEAWRDARTPGVGGASFRPSVNVRKSRRCLSASTIWLPAISSTPGTGAKSFAKM